MLRPYKSEELEKVVELAKSMGLRVWTWESDEPITQVFFGDEKTYGSAQVCYWGGIEYFTCHEPGTSCGTGFRLYSEGTVVRRHLIEEALAYAPGWAIHKGMAAGLRKLPFEQSKRREKILKYYEL